MSEVDAISELVEQGELSSTPEVVDSCPTQEVLYSVDGFILLCGIAFGFKG